LIISGAVGIGIGDTAYFGCIRKIGPQKGLMLESSAPMMAAVLAMVLFSEMLLPQAWMGILITTSGIILVIKFSLSQERYRSSINGILLGLFAAFAQAAGIVLSRMSLAGGQVDPLASSLIRLVAGLTVLFCFMFLQKLRTTDKSGQMQTLSTAIRLILKHRLIMKAVVAVLAGTFFALWLQQLSVKYTTAGVAQTLLGTCPLFGMLIGVIQGRKQPAVVWFGLALGLSGIGLLFIS
jgi:drug/metabolite transporter (DMT)-like permease